MSYNGSGTFLINTSGQPVVTGTTISSTAFNALTSDLATGLSTAVTKDGQTTPTANLPMGGFKLTGLGAGSAATDSVRLGQLQAGAATLLSSVSGTNTITATASPTLTAYASGNVFTFIPANTNTGATTLNIDGLGAKSIFSGGAAVIGGELVASVPFQVEYDGTQFNLLTPYIQTGTVSTTWTFDGTGGTSGSVTLTYQRVGKWVTLHIPAFTATSGTSSTTATNNTAIPAVIRPTTQQDFAMTNMTNNNTVSSSSPGVVRMNAGSGTINIFRDNSQSAFTNASTCGLRAGITVSYFVG